jgi:hypothetical protein
MSQALITLGQARHAKVYENRGGENGGVAGTSPLLQPGPMISLFA